MQVEVSQFATACFIALVGVVGALFVWACAITARRSGESISESLMWAVIAVVIASLWLNVSAFFASTGLLARWSAQPPPFLILVGATTVATTLLAFSPVGTRLASGVGFAGLIGFQAFRIPVELFLHRVYQEGIIPVQMTYSGRNFDIVSGVLGAVIGVWCLMARPRKPPPPRWALLGFNLVGIALLAHIVAIAIMSTPTAFRHFHNEPTNTFIARVPFVWLPAFLVQAAWFGHLLVFRKLARRATS